MMMSDEEERLVAMIETKLKERAKADPRSIKEIVNGALEREFSTTETAAVERRIDEKQQRIQTLEREINDRQRKLAEEEDGLERLKKQLSDFETHKNNRLEEAREALSDVPREVDNPGIKNWAGKLGMTPNELLEEL